MKGWFKCSQCAHQWETSGPNFSSECPKCGCTSGDCEIGSKAPDWYSGAKPKSLLGRLSAALERKPS